jgi:hypothetical protein
MDPTTKSDTKICIVQAEIHPSPGMGHMAKVTAKLSDGTNALVFQFYDDELHFSSTEFIGLTMDEAHALKQRKDRAYLQS